MKENKKNILTIESSRIYHLDQVHSFDELLNEFWEEFLGDNWTEFDHLKTEESENGFEGLIQDFLDIKFTYNNDKAIMLSLAVIDGKMDELENGDAESVTGNLFLTIQEYLQDKCEFQIGTIREISEEMEDER